jgi:hypothetical protein
MCHPLCNGLDNAPGKTACVQEICASWFAIFSFMRAMLLGLSARLFSSVQRLVLYFLFAEGNARASHSEAGGIAPPFEPVEAFGVSWSHSEAEGAAFPLMFEV